MKYKVERTDGTPIPEDEPCFVVRAKDAFAPVIVKAYFDLAERNGAPQEFLNQVDEHLVKIQEYQWANPGKVKYPD